MRRLPPHTRSLAELTFDEGEAHLDAGDCMTRHRTAGLLVLKDDEVALER
jgi:hypothetical protein